jgi:ketosteroid isomerase-like protein
LTGKAELGAGFGAFLAMTPYTMRFNPAVVEGEKTAIVYGDWSFDGKSADGPVHIEARATVVLVKRNDEWHAVVDDFFSAA